MIIIIILIVFTFSSLLLQYRADHANINKRNKKKIALIVLCFTFIGFVINSFIQYFDRKGLSKDISAIKNDLSNSQKDRNSILNKLNEISTQINPFLKLAIQKYPETDSLSALKKLYKEIETVKVQVQQVSVQDVFLPLSKTIKNQLIKYLKNNNSFKNVSFLIEDWTGNLSNRQFSQQLVEILLASGYSASKDDAMGIQGGYIPPPIEINVTPENRLLFDEFIKITKPMFFNYEPKIRPKQGMSGKMLRLRIFGKPKFNAEGQISYY